jgi:hypothetical protein
MHLPSLATRPGVLFSLSRVTALRSLTAAILGLAVTATLASAAYSTSQQAQINADTPAAGANFGTSVAISGDVALVGAPKATVGANANQGAAYIYTRSGGVWTFQAKLTASDGATSGAFGTSVALQSGTAIIGATGGNAAYVFTGAGSSWTQSAKLTSGDASTTFGQAVALDSGTVIVGATNAAYVFTGAAASWTQQTKLTAAGAGFGASVALSGNTALVGAPNATGQFSTSNAGLAYGFLRTGTAWSSASSISEGAAVEVNHRFGTCVALSGNTAFISNNAGTAYALTRANGTTANFPAPNFNDVVVTLSGTRVAADADSAVSASGGVLSIYKLASGSWGLVAQSTTNSASGFGASIALAGDTVVLGAPTTTVSSAANAGTGFVYTFADSGGLPVVASPSSASIAATSATLGGNVTSDGGSALTAVGVVVSPTGTNASPQLSGTGVIDFPGTTGLGAFTVSATGLTGGTGYSYAAYATTSAGTSYSSVDTFTTLSAAVAPTVTTPTSASVAVTTATLGGNVTADGGATVTERGIVYAVTATNAAPQISGTGVVKVTGTGTTGVFTVPVTGLAGTTGYSYAAYATNSAGTTYSSVATFTTLTPVFAPTITTPTSASVATTTATLGGNVTSDGNGTITERGVVYAVTATNASPQISGTGVTKVLGTGTTGVFTVPVSGLAPGTGYSFAAYAINSAGTTYTSPVSTFTTLSTNANLSTLALSAGTLAPAFDGATTSYTATVVNGIATLTVTPTVADATASVKVNNTTVVSGNASGPLALTLGDNAITTVVTAQDGTTTKTYTITVTRLPAPPVISSTLTATGTYGSAFTTYTIVASDSPVSYNATGLPAGLSINPANGQITGTPTTAVGSPFSVTLAATNAGGTGNATLVLTVNKVGLTVSGATVAGKVYDRLTTAVPSFTGASLVGILSGDTANVSLVTSGAAATFADKTVGVAKPVTVTGLTLGGSAAANYALTQPTGLTASITAKNLTVTGVTAVDRAYNGGTSATLGFSGIALVGVVSGDTVTPVTSGATGTFATAGVGLAKTVTIAGLALSGADAANYTVTQPTATATITPASATIAITNLAHTYDGTPKAATVTVTPSATTSIVYSNTSSGTPTAAGSYIVSANITDPNYSGSAIGTLVIAKAAQTVTLAIGGSDFKVGTSHSLTATASSGLPVTFSLAAGTATLSGSTVTVTQAGSVTVRATQAGNENYLPATAEQGFTGVATTGQTAQNIAFSPILEHTIYDRSFDLFASATSGLPVSFTVVSGPATVSGNTVFLLNTAGTVTIRASQAGNATYGAASDVTRSFDVVDPRGEDVFFGDLNDDGGTSGDSAARGELIQAGGPQIEAKKGDIAAVYFAATKRGTVVIVAPALNLSASIDFAIAANGTYSTSFTSNGRALVLSGSLNGSALTGRIAALGVSFTTQVQALTGSTAVLAGYYQSSSLASAGGGTTTIIGPNGQLLIVATSATGTTGATGTIAANGSFTAQASGVTITGAVDPSTTSISGTVAATGQSPVAFSGLAASTARTDRLINLSSRVRIAPAAGRTLITGFVIGGTASKRLLLRAVGPALSGFGVTGALVNPKLQLFDAAGKVLLENDDWSGTDTATTAAQVGAFALTAGSKDAAVVTTLAPGAYSMQITAGTESGSALAEIYDASATAGTDTQRLVNISTRGTVDVGADGGLIGGFVVTGNAPKKVLIRGVGPGLGAFGVAGTLADPRLAVYSGSTLVAQNDDWSVPTALTATQTAATAAEISAAAMQVGGFALGAGSKDAAVLLTLAPGAYTAQVSAANNATGVALVEIYEVP